MRAARIKDVASKAGVAILTARRALSGHPSVRSYVRERIEQAARELNYRPNLIARAMAKRSSNLVTVTLHGLHNPLFGQMADCLLRRLRAAEFHPIFFDSLEAVTDFNTTFFAAGSILLYAGAPQVNAIHRERAVVTFCGHDYQNQTAPDVSIDLSAAYMELTRKALAEGRRKFGLFVHPSLSTYAERMEPITRVLSEAGLELIPAAAELYDNNAEQASAVRLADLIAERRALDTVFCGWDMAAARLLVELRRRGLSVPGDVRIIGCDGTVPLPDVWTIPIDIEAISTQLIELLQRQMNGHSFKERSIVVSQALTDWNQDRRVKP